jgi:hypothetical protein
VKELRSVYCLVQGLWNEAAQLVNVELSQREISLACRVVILYEEHRTCRAARLTVIADGKKGLSGGKIVRRNRKLTEEVPSKWHGNFLVMNRARLLLPLRFTAIKHLMNGLF